MSQAKSGVPNLFRAIHKETEQAHYLAGRFDEESQLYFPYGHNRGGFLRQTSGNFAQMVSHIDEGHARRQCLRRDGYSRVINATANLGDEYKALVKTNGG